MENLGKIPMENLSENEERIWKLLSQFLNGATARKLQQITFMRKTTLYNALNGLKSKGFVEHKKRIWSIKEKQTTKPQKSSFFSEWKAQSQEQKDKELRRIQCEEAIILEEIDLKSSGELNENAPDYFRKKNEIRLRNLKRYKLIP